METSQLKKQVKKLPAKPGIYLFRNSRKRPLYIGKALNLKNRVKNYLKVNDPRLVKMLADAKKIDFIQTDSDIEALILESQYIKKIQPPFNIMLRDDKQYSFVVFTKDVYPKIFITHQPQIHEDVIGPFTDAGALKTTLNLLRRIFPYCTCKQLHNNYCLNYHIGKCPGFCCLKKPTTDNLQLTTYKKNIKAIKDILSGKKSSLIKNLEKEMRALSGKQEFEKAMELQYKIEKLKRVFQNAQIIHKSYIINHKSETAKNSTGTLKQLAKAIAINSTLHRIEAYDIANIQGKHAVGAMVVFQDGVPNKNEYRKFKIYKTATPDDTAMLKEVLIRRFNHPEWTSPKLIVIDGGKGQLNVARSLTKKIPIIAVTKNEHHVGEKIYISGKKYPIPLSRLPRDVKNLLLHLDSEAHRFAINYYRKLHAKSLQ